MKRVGIVGFGLIGGSLALALREQYPEIEIVACDFAAVLASERAQELSSTRVDISDRQRLKAALGSVELSVLAAPVLAIIELLPDALEACALVTDCGSTKRAILAQALASAHRARFVPGHPMAGWPRGGLNQARAGLFRGQSWVLCPEGCAADGLARVANLVRAIGAEPVLMNADEHDRAVAVTSHLPQLLASALAVLAGRAHADRAGGPAFAGMTRVAGGSAAMWGDIFATNADAISKALGELKTELDKITEGLENPAVDVNPALEILAKARQVIDR